ncbi:MAG: M23 family metallopeptidase [Clostridia bacterium]|nr:M23 family metallopeptidase [Clostridia bacterium]
MEKKAKKISINTVIYLLLAAMFIAVIAISIFTTASKRRGENPDTNDSVSGSLGADDTTVRRDMETTRPDRTPSNSDTADSVTPGETTGTKDKNTPASNDTEADVAAGSELRYFVAPVVGSVSKAFEVDIPVYSLTMNDYRAHTGVDIAAELGSEVVTASNGIVCKIWNDPLMGRCIMVDHGDNIYTTYMNLSVESGSDLEVGGKVSMGQAIGTVGESALIEIAEEPHLHLEMKVDGNYVNPLEYMGVSAEQDMAYED